MAINTKTGARLLVLTTIAASAWACGAFKKNKSDAKDKKGEHHDAPPPGPPPPIAIDDDVDGWANRSITALSLPAADKDAVKPHDSCQQYYDSMLGYAQAMEAIHVKRFLAWSRYQLAVGGFGVLAKSGGFPGGGPMGNKSSGGDDGGADNSAPTSSKADSAPSAPSAASSEAASVGKQASPTAPGAVASEYQTNNQVQGVDETDYVKSNGRYVFVAHGNLLRVIDLAGNIVYAAQIAGENPRGLHLVGNKLALITESSVANPYQTPNIDLPFDNPDYWWAYWGYNRQRTWFYTQVTNVHEFTIGDDGKLTPAKDRKYFGNFRDGREIGGTVHLVLQKQLPWNILSTGLDLYGNGGLIFVKDDAALKTYAKRLAEENLNAWRRYMFEDGDLMAEHSQAYKAGHCAAFTRLTSTTADAIAGAELVKLYQAWDTQLAYSVGIQASIYNSYPTFPSYDNVTEVASFDLEGANPDAVSMTISPVSANMVYASADRLVVGSQRYEWFNYWRQIYVLPAVPAKPAIACIGAADLCAAIGTAPATGVVPISVVPAVSITKTTNFFDFLTFKLDEAGATPSGLGTVPGTPVNNYAIDATANTVRFVVTENRETAIAPGGGVIQVVKAGPDEVVSSGPIFQQNQQVSSLKVFKADGTVWTQAASVALDVGGYVSGVRFLGNVAFVSTQNASDPLYALDVSDELNPKLVGKMPDDMRASYFHPMGDGKTILALGRSEPALIPNFNYYGYTLTVKMIDVANVAAPVVLSSMDFQVGGSQAEYDFKAFRFIPRLGLLVLPMDYPFRLELAVADRDKGFAHFGTIQLQDKLTQYYGIGGSPRTMLFDDLLLGVFGNQDVGAQLDFAAKAPALTYAKSVSLLYKSKVVEGWPYFWYLESATQITPKWRSATLLQ